MNKVIFFYVALALIILIGSYSMVLAVMLDKAHKEIKQLRKENYNLRTPF